MRILSSQLTTICFVYFPLSHRVSTTDEITWHLEKTSLSQVTLENSVLTANLCVLVFSVSKQK